MVTYRENLPVTKIWQLIEKVTGNFTVLAPRSHFVNEISKEPAAPEREALLQLANHVSNHGDTNSRTRER